MADQDLRITVSHLPIFTEIRLVLELEDYYCINAPMTLDSKVKWRSSAVFLTDSKGQIDLSKTPALKGSYTGINAMGLFETAQPERKRKRKSQTPVFKDLSLNDRFYCKITAFKDNTAIGCCSFQRYYLPKTLRFKNIYLNKAKARLFYGKEWRNRPAIIVLSGSEGGLEKAQNIAQLLASRGFVTMSLAYFGLDGLPADLCRIPLESIEEALAFLKSSSLVDSQRIGIYGRSKGAELALLAASYFQEIKAIVANAPTDCVYEGLKGKWNAGCSSWTYREKEIPYTKFQLLNFAAERFFHKKLLKKNTASLFSMADISAPCLFIAALEDEIWDAYGAVTNIMKQLKDNTKHDFLITPHLGHMNTVSYQPNWRYRKWPLSVIQSETRRSWQATVEHFQHFL